MILAYVTMGIADLSQGAGKLLLITAIIAYGSTLIGGTFSFAVADTLFPSFISAGVLEELGKDRRQEPAALLLHFHSAHPGHHLRCGTGLHCGPVPVLSPGQGNRGYPVQLL